MLAITLTETEAYSIVRRRCKALSRRMVACPYEVGTQIVARVREGENTRPYALLTVKTVRPMTVGEVTDTLATLEGFSGLPAWGLNQAKIYGGDAGSSGISIVRIGFDVDKMLTEADNVGSNNRRAE